jgi:phosphoserine phosphatase RsbU/P
MDQIIVTEEECNPEYVLELKKQNHTLKKLAKITRIINASLDISKLLKAVMEAVKQIMQTEASSLLFYDEKSDELVFKVALGKAGEKLEEKYRIKSGIGIVGWVAKHRLPLIINDVYTDERFNPEFDRITGFTTRDVICLPLLFKGKLIGVIEGINPKDRDEFTDEDLELFQAFADQAVMAVQNAILFENALEEKRIRGELDSARTIQQNLLQPFAEDLPGFSIACQSITALEVGGEFYDFFDFGNKLYGITLGDIHVKGIPGALSAAMISGAIKMLAYKRGTRPIAFIKELGRFICDNVSSFKEVSFFYSLYNSLEKTLEFANTGFAYPILVRDGVARYLKFNTHSFKAPDQACATEVEYPKKVRVHLRSNDVFVIVTDGIINLRNNQAQQFGLKRVMDIIQSVDGTPVEIIDALKHEADTFVGKLEKREDISIICFKVE